MKKVFLLLMTFCILYSSANLCAEEKEVLRPVKVNGDKVEYFPEKGEVRGEGNVVVEYYGARLTCDIITVNLKTKEAVAEGNVKFEQNLVVSSGERLIYNFDTREGFFVNWTIHTKSSEEINPLIAQAREARKLSDNEFYVTDGYVTTCDLDEPHYRMEAREIRIFLGEKVELNNARLYVGDRPVFYMPRYNYSLKGKGEGAPFAFIPGESKDWGWYALTASSFSFNDYIKGRYIQDYRELLGAAEGVEIEYDTVRFGKGEFVSYYMQERDKKLPEGRPAEKERFRIKLIHKWRITEQLNFAGEFHRWSDESMLKDFFEYEYELEREPETQVFLTQNWDMYSANVTMQKRANRFFGVTERLPEARFNVKKQRLFQMPLYVDGELGIANFDKKTAYTGADDDATRIDSLLKFSLPKKFGDVNFTPHTALRYTYYSKDAFGDERKNRSLLEAGMDLRTKLFRVYDVGKRLPIFKVDKLRHIITPIVDYTYRSRPTIGKDSLFQFDNIDALEKKSKFSLALENKFQAKKDGKTYDLMRFILWTDYDYQATGGSKFNNIKGDIELLPYSWMRIESDITYDTSVNDVETWNVDLYSNKSSVHRYGFGYRYQRKQSSEITTEFGYRLSKKWKFRVYGRYEFETMTREEEEYSVTRDLHCWELDVTYNRKESDTIWIALRLKDLPKLPIIYKTGYQAPKGEVR